MTTKLPTRRQLFATAKAKEADNFVGTKVRFRLNKSKGLLEEMPVDEKMLCALRKVLADMSNKERQYYIAGDKVRVIARGGGAGSKTYTAEGSFSLGSHVGGAVMFKPVSFSITFKDTRDSRGLPDVEYIDPTAIDELPPGVSV